MTRRGFLLAAMVPQITVADACLEEPTPAQTDLTLKEAVDIVADYEILHPLMPDRAQLYGVSDFDGQRITVAKNTDLTQRRKIAIHEMLHVVRRMRGISSAEESDEEDAVRPAVEKIYRELFG